MNRFSVIATCLVIAACTATPTATIPPSPRPVKVTYSPSLVPIEEALHTCAEDHPEIALIAEKKPVSSIDLEDIDLSIWWGEKPSDTSFAYPLAQDELVVILNQENLNSNLSASELRALYTGAVLNWNEISTYQAVVSVWIYPLSNELRRIFQENLLGEQRVTSLAYQAPDPQAMLEAVARDPGAIGFIPRSWLNEDINITQIDQEFKTAMGKPILALANSEPRAGSLIFLHCLQSGVGQTKLLNYFSPPK
jgi:hypothetical protein